MDSGDNYVSPEFKDIETQITYVSIVWGKPINIFTQSIIYQHNIDKALIQYKMSSYQHGKSHCGDRRIVTIGFPLLIGPYLYIESDPWSLKSFPSENT